MNRNTIIAIAIGAVILLVVVYMLFLKPGPTTAVEATGQPTSVAENTFVNLAAQLEPLGFDTAILSDPRFNALVDIHTAIVPETTGRHDPFAPF